jgi:hypothetical protein
MTLLTYILGLDLEMAFKHHYHEVLDTIGDMFTQIFRGLRDRYQVGPSVFTKILIFLNFADHFPHGKSPQNNYREFFSRVWVLFATSVAKIVSRSFGNCVTNYRISILQRYLKQLLKYFM